MRPPPPLPKRKVIAMSNLQNEPPKVKLHGLWVDINRSLGFDKVEFVFLCTRSWVERGTVLGAKILVMIPTQGNAQLEVRTPLSVDLVNERFKEYDVVEFRGLSGQIRGSFGYNVIFEATDVIAVKGEDYLWDSEE